VCVTSERWRELEDLYQAAQGLPPAERDRLLGHADPELRATVESILAQEDSPGIGASSLDRPAWEGRDSLLKTDTICAAGTVAAGMQLGPYRIERRIGQGGMGDVFRVFSTACVSAVVLIDTPIGQ
jgi:serine/threonine-protein kinase